MKERKAGVPVSDAVEKRQCAMRGCAESRAGRWQASARPLAWALPARSEDVAVRLIVFALRNNRYLLLLTLFTKNSKPSLIIVYPRA